MKLNKKEPKKVSILSSLSDELDQFELHRFEKPSYAHTSKRTILRKVLLFFFGG